MQRLLLPDESIAMFVTTVVPTGKVDPDGGVEVIVTFVQLSTALTLNNTLLRDSWPASAQKARLFGQMICGTSLSRIVTVKVQTLELPKASVATLVTMVVPTGKNEPDSILELTVTEEQLSMALTENVTLLRPH